MAGDFGVSEAHEFDRLECRQPFAADLTREEKLSMRPIGHGMVKTVTKTSCASASVPIFAVMSALVSRGVDSWLAQLPTDIKMQKIAMVTPFGLMRT
jgi:hypothetical protein